jgi:hypothetical protein
VKEIETSTEKCFPILGCFNSLFLSVAAQSEADLLQPARNHAVYGGASCRSEDMGREEVGRYVSAYFEYYLFLKTVAYTVDVAT